MTKTIREKEKIDDDNKDNDNAADDDDDDEVPVLKWGTMRQLGHERDDERTRARLWLNRDSRRAGRASDCSHTHSSFTRAEYWFRFENVTPWEGQGLMLAGAQKCQLSHLQCVCPAHNLTRHFPSFGFCNFHHLVEALSTELLLCETDWSEVVNRNKSKLFSNWYSICIYWKSDSALFSKGTKHTGYILSCHYFICL